MFKVKQRNSLFIYVFWLDYTAHLWLKEITQEHKYVIIFILSHKILAQMQASLTYF